MKTQAEIEAMPERLRRGWLAAELIAAHNLAIGQMLTAAVATGRLERMATPNPQQEEST